MADCGSKPWHQFVHAKMAGIHGPTNAPEEWAFLIHIHTSPDHRFTLVIPQSLDISMVLANISIILNSLNMCLRSRFMHSMHSSPLGSKHSKPKTFEVQSWVVVVEAKMSSQHLNTLALMVMIPHCRSPEKSIKQGDSRLKNCRWVGNKNYRWEVKICRC